MAKRKRTQSAKPKARRNPFANIKPTDPEQVALGALKVLKLSADGGKTYEDFPVLRFHYNANVLEADIAGTDLMTIHPELVFVAKTNTDRDKGRMWSGKVTQYRVTDTWYRLRIG